VIGNIYQIEGGYTAQRVGERNLQAVSTVADALPMLLAGAPDITDIETLLEVVDGVLLTGARPNVHPSYFGTEPHPSHEPYDENRDAVARKLTRACIDRGIPAFGVCRGFQERCVTFGSSLHPENRDLPRRIHYRVPRLESGERHPYSEVVFADRHGINLLPGAFLISYLAVRQFESIRSTVKALPTPGIASSLRVWWKTVR
jgi:putative glutamine amidotransferase